MKKLLTLLILCSTAVIHSTSAVAHTGHMPVESVHSYLHAEHIMIVSVIVVVAYVASTLFKR